MDVQLQRISIRSLTHEITRMNEEFVALLESLDFSPREVFGVQLALEEALTNAVKHGNCLDPEKQVHISFLIDEEKFWVQIEDEGQGFKLQDVPDPTSQDCIPRPGGRGLHLMHHVMDGVEYNERGNVVTLHKFRGSDQKA